MLTVPDAACFRPRIFNKLVIPESRGTAVADAKNQSLAAAILAGIS